MVGRSIITQTVAGNGDGGLVCTITKENAHTW